MPTSTFAQDDSASTTISVAAPLDGDGSSGDPVTLPASATLTTPVIGVATGTSLNLSGNMRAASYNAGATPGVTAGPFTVVTGIQVTAGLVTTLTGT